MSAASPPYDFSTLLTVDGLSVVTDEDEVVKAICQGAYQTNVEEYLMNRNLPVAVMAATSVQAVQAVVQYCTASQTTTTHNDLKLSVRSGGHSWQCTWLLPATATNNNNSNKCYCPSSYILLDVGDMNSIEYHPETTLVKVGPGATGDAIHQQLPPDRFLPTGHCKGVPVGGFVLTGGYGLGFQKYGMACTLVTSVQVVLASTGDVRDIDVIVKHAADGGDAGGAEDEIATAVSQLMRGSYHRFPGVITQYTMKTVPMPQTVLTPLFVFDLKDWKRALKLGRDLAHPHDSRNTNQNHSTNHNHNKDDNDDANDDEAQDKIMMETTLILGHSKDFVQKATGQTQMAALAVTVWSDDDLETTRAMVHKYTKHVLETEDDVLAMPSIVRAENLYPVDPKTITEIFAPSYAEHKRYMTEGWLGDERFFDVDDGVFEQMLQPLVDFWAGRGSSGDEDDDDEVPPAPSHTILPLIPRNMPNNTGLSCGVTPSFKALSYAIYDDATKDDLYRNALFQAQAGFLNQKEGVYTQIGEGRIRNCQNALPIHGDQAESVIARYVAVLDPKGLFDKKL